MVLVGDVQRGQHCQAERIHRGGLLGNAAHLSVNKLGQFEDVFGVSSAQVVSLIVNLHPDWGSGCLCGQVCLLLGRNRSCSTDYRASQPQVKQIIVVSRDDNRRMPEI